MKDISFISILKLELFINKSLFDEKIITEERYLKVNKILYEKIKKNKEGKKDAIL